MRATLIILNSDKILLIHRLKFWDDFYVFPWWWIEDWETPKEAAKREMIEETWLNPLKLVKLFEYKNDSDSRIHQVYLCTKFKWELMLWGPEIEKHSIENQYIHEWHDLKTLENLKLLPILLRDKILQD